MIKSEEFYELLNTNGIEFFAGVPDSLLKHFNACVTLSSKKQNNIITANEGAAVAIASGYYLATEKIPLVYLQNSGLGNIINPLLSLADREVYSIPILLVIGWRGQPGVSDEPQHVKQGRVTERLLDALEIPYTILRDSSHSTLQDIVSKAVDYLKKQRHPYALLVPKGIFEEFKYLQSDTKTYQLNREEALKCIVNLLEMDDIVISTTGKTSRELFEYREHTGSNHNRDFLTVGSMGHANQIALGIALNKQSKSVYCFDGDGAVIMHLGSIGIIGDMKPNNFKHVIFNNGSHDSVGGQPTIGYKINFENLFRSLGYRNVFTAKDKDELKVNFRKLADSKGPSLLHVYVNKGARKDLGRPTLSAQENKKNFMEFLRNI